MDKCHHFEFPSHLYREPCISCLIESMCVLVPVRAYVLRVRLWRLLGEDMPGQRAQWVR